MGLTLLLVIFLGPFLKALGTVEMHLSESIREGHLRLAHAIVRSRLQNGIMDRSERYFFTVPSILHSNLETRVEILCFDKGQEI